jgi:hypothetical protein
MFTNSLFETLRVTAVLTVGLLQVRIRVELLAMLGFGGWGELWCMVMLG